MKNVKGPKFATLEAVLMHAESQYVAQMQDVWVKITKANASVFLVLKGTHLLLVAQVNHFVFNNQNYKDKLSNNRWENNLTSAINIINIFVL